MDDGVWKQRGDKAQAGLAPLLFLVGEWRGTGTCHGRGITAQLVVKTILDGTWIEARETHFDDSGAQEHTDVSLYRFDPDEDHLRVLHLVEGEDKGIFVEGLQALNQLIFVDALEYLALGDVGVGAGLDVFGAASWHGG